MPSVVKAKDKRAIKNRSQTYQSLWGKSQAEKRNSNVARLVKKSAIAMNNEQTHWESIPLQHSLQAILCQNVKTVNSLFTHRCRGTRPKNSRNPGFVWPADRKIPVIIIPRLQNENKHKGLLSLLQR